MKRRLVLLLLILVMTRCIDKKLTFEAPVLKNIGDYQVTVTTNSEYSQLFFNQGVIMANGFNHAEAERSFRESIRQDSTFAMGYWGIAYVLGPNYNSGGENMGAINDIKTAVTNAVKSTVSDISDSVSGQIGLKNEQNAAQSQSQNQPQDQVQQAEAGNLQTERTKEMVRDFYSPSDDLV